MLYEKEIVYDPTTRDFAMFLDGELVGFARTYQEAEVTLDQLIFELVSSEYLHETPVRERRGSLSLTRMPASAGLQSCATTGATPCSCPPGHVA